MTGIVSSSWLTLETLNALTSLIAPPLPERAPAMTSTSAAAFTSSYASDAGAQIGGRRTPRSPPRRARRSRSPGTRWHRRERWPADSPRRSTCPPTPLPRRWRSRCSAGGQRLLRRPGPRSEEHTSELQSQSNLVCRLLLEKKKKNKSISDPHLYNLTWTASCSKLEHSPYAMISI